MTEVPLAPRAASLPLPRRPHSLQHNRSVKGTHPSEKEVAEETRKILEAFLAGELEKGRLYRNQLYPYSTRRPGSVPGPPSISAPSSVQFPHKFPQQPENFRPDRSSEIFCLPEVAHERDSSMASGSRPQSMELDSRRTSVDSRDRTNLTVRPDSLDFGFPSIASHDLSPVSQPDSQFSEGNTVEIPGSQSSRARTTTDGESSTNGADLIRYRAKKRRFKLVRERLERTFKRPESRVGKKKQIKKHESVRDPPKHLSLPEGVISGFHPVPQMADLNQIDSTASENNLRLNRSVSDSARKALAAQKIVDKYNSGRRIPPANRRQRKRSVISRIGSALHNLKKDEEGRESRQSVGPKRPDKLPVSGGGGIGAVIARKWKKIGEIAHGGSMSGLNSIQNPGDSLNAGVAHRTSGDFSHAITHDPGDLFSPSEGVHQLELSDDNRSGNPTSNSQETQETSRPQSPGKGSFDGFLSDRENYPMIDGVEDPRTLDEKLNRIADRLAQIGDEYMDQTEAKRLQLGEVLACRENEASCGGDPERMEPWERDIYAYCVEHREKLQDNYPNKSIFESLARAGNSEQFSDIVKEVLPHEETRTQLAMTFYLTSFAIKMAGVGTSAAVRLKDYCSSFISRNFAGWIADQGGWMSAVDESSCSDLD